MWKALVLSLVLAPCIFSTMTNKHRLRSFLEQHKPEHTKREMFTCGNGEETYIDFICDGDNDCGDCSDEMANDCTLPCVEGLWNADDNTTTLHDININGTVIGPVQDEVFQCANNQTTSISYICDGDNDCGDCSDESAEQGCTEPCVPGMWRADDFQCSNGESTDADYICDGDNDCGDCSDERQAGCTEPCVEGLWNPDDFACDNGESTSPAYLCDGDNDCNDCSDERQAGCTLPCVEGQWNARTLNKKRQQKKTLMKKNIKRESTPVADPMAVCIDACKEQTGCTEDNRLNQGCNQMLSCSHACKIRALGEDEHSCKQLCERNGQSGCGVTVKDWTFRLCTSCQRSGCNTHWPTIQECQVGCYSYGSNTGKQSAEVSEESSEESNEDESMEPLQCLYEISNAIHEHPDYSHLHNNTDVNHVCDILLMDHREYFCGCMDEVSSKLSPDQANLVLAMHPHGINIEGLAWEKECCCNEDIMCPVEENHAMACMTTISVAMEHWSQTTNLTAHTANGHCDVDGTVKDFFCGCMSELAYDGTSDADIEELLSLHSHGITLDMLKVEAGACCLPPPPVPATVAPTSLPTAAPTSVARRRMLKKLQYLLNKRRV